MCVCTSTPPGMMYLPLASMARVSFEVSGSPTFHSRFRDRRPPLRRSRELAPAPGASTAAIVSPSISTSATVRPRLGLTTAPPRIRTLVISAFPGHAGRSRPLPPLALRSLANSRCLPPILGRSRRRRRGGDRGRTPSGSRTCLILSRSSSRMISSGLLRIADVADELALRVDEIALPVEVVVADVGLDAGAIDRSDVIHVGDRRCPAARRARCTRTARGAWPTG